MSLLFLDDVFVSVHKLTQPKMIIRYQFFSPDQLRGLFPTVPTSSCDLMRTILFFFESINFADFSYLEQRLMNFKPNFNILKPGYRLEIVFRLWEVKLFHLFRLLFHSVHFNT